MEIETPVADTDAPIAATTADTAAAVTEYNPEDFYADDKPKVAPEQQDGAEGEGDAGEDGGGAPDPEPITAPASWAKDYKDQFASLPREMQEIISTRETERETFLQAKSREAAQTRQTVETQARGALQTIMENHQRQLSRYADQFDVHEPDLSLLNSDDPQHRTIYFQQMAAYRSGTAQREQIEQQIRETEHYAGVIAQQQQQSELSSEEQILDDQLGTKTGWSEPSSRAKLISEYEPIAAELGYPKELIAQARAPDIIALKRYSDMKTELISLRAMRDQLNKAKMVPVRAARGIPPTARTGNPGGQQTPADAVSLLYPNDVRRN